MNAGTLIRGTLMALGIANLVFEGMTLKSRSRVVDPGRLPVETSVTRTLSLPPVAGVVALVGGLVLMLIGAASLIVPVTARRGEATRPR